MYTLAQSTHAQSTQSVVISASLVTVFGHEHTRIMLVSYDLDPSNRLQFGETRWGTPSATLISEADIQLRTSSHAHGLCLGLSRWETVLLS